MQTDTTDVRPTAPTEEPCGYAPEFPPCWDDYRAARERALRRLIPSRAAAETPAGSALPLR